MKIIPKRFSEKDIVTRVNWINNPSISGTMFFDLPATAERTEKWFISNIANEKRIDFTFVDQYDNTLAMGGLTDISKEHRNAEFYVMVNPDKHGNGIGKEVSKWMCNYAFSVLKFNKI